MAVREIVVIEHPVLRRKAKKIVKITAEHRKLIEDMIETMRDAPGVGLAAPQVGVSERLIVVEYADEPEDEDDAAQEEETLRRDQPGDRMRPRKRWCRAPKAA